MCMLRDLTQEKGRGDGRVSAVLLVNFFSVRNMYIVFLLLVLFFSLIADMYFSSGCMHFLFTFFFHVWILFCFSHPPTIHSSNGPALRSECAVL